MYCVEASAVNKKPMANELRRIRRWDIQQRDRILGNRYERFAPEDRDGRHEKLRRGNQRHSES